MVAFPSFLPNPQYNSHTFEVRTGVARTAMQAGNYKQRRVWHHLPVQWSLTWAVSTREMNSIVRWLNDYGYDWFDINVVSPLTPVDSPLRLMSVRVISNLDVSNAGFNYWEISAIVEGAPEQTLEAG